MRINFSKFQATGNDFVLIDNRSDARTYNVDQIKRICDRRFGVGADGLVLIENDGAADFKMIYYNNDGTQSLCGNGCRSAVNFASSLKIFPAKETKFTAYDGIHQAIILDNNIVSLKLNDVRRVEQINKDFFIDTGSPHYIRFVTDLDEIDVVEEGRKIRHSDQFKPDGTNVNFVQLLPNNVIAVRTYERGVEDETLSCGTGITAAALAAHFQGYASPVNVTARGGKLTVKFNTLLKSDTMSGSANDDNVFSDIFLIGPAKMVFEGQMEL